MHGLDGVGVDDLFVRFPLLLRVGSLVDELHLFENGRFPRFSRSEQQHFTVDNLVSGAEGNTAKGEAYISFLGRGMRKSARAAKQRERSGRGAGCGGGVRTS